MTGTNTLQMDEMEALRDRLFIARNHRAELEEQLTAAKQMLEVLYERVTPATQECATLGDRLDG